MKNPYETLDVPRDATTDEIRRAYRRKAQKAHPDRNGNAAEFHALTEARALLTNSARRDRYDRTGEDGPVADERTQLMGEIAKLIVTALENIPDIDHIDVIEQCITVIQNNRENAISQIGDLNTRIAKFKRAAKRLSGGDGMVKSMIEGHIRSRQREIESNNENIALMDKMIALLAEHKYQVDPIVTSTPTSIFTTIFTTGGGA